MPTFRFNKLVRDKFQAIYADLDQTITFQRLGDHELKEQLHRKLLEETAELSVREIADEKVIDEIGDVQQVLDDLRTVYGVSSEQMKKAMAKKFAKKGGFTGGLYVKTITLKDGDSWVQYYRNEPEKYPELREDGGKAKKTAA